MFKLALLLNLFVIVSVRGQCNRNLLNDLTFHLSGSSFEWPDVSTKNIYIQTGRYIPKSVLITRTQIYRDEAFVAIPRLKAGVPITLGKVSLKKGSCSIQVSPFTCWAFQEEGNCQALQSVVDLYLDPQVCIFTDQKSTRRLHQ
jgi:hypothetical protein